MKKMSLIIGVAAFVCAALIFTGCESPTDSSAGAPGADGAVTLSASSVSATDLEAVFKVTDRILLLSDVLSVEGKIPAGKTLIVAGATTAIEDGKGLEVEGTLEIFENAKLDASGVSNTAGYLIGTGPVTGYGVVALPYLDGELPEGSPSYITYASGNVSAAGKYAASYSTGEADSTAITKENATTILALDGVSTLTLSGIAVVQDITIPANKTLTLIGASNTITGGFDLSAETTGSLVVANGASLAVSGGALKGSITNNGTITTTETTAANVVSYITVPTGAGKVNLSETVDLGGTASLTLTQNVEIAASKTLTAPALTTAGAAFDGGKTITVNGTLALPANVNAVGATIVNRGTVSTATTSAATLNTFLALTGNITATAAVTVSDAITVPAATKLSIASGVTFTVTGTLEVPGEGGFVTTGATLTITGNGQVIENVSEEYGLSTVDNSVAANNEVLGSPTVLKATAKKVRTASTTASPTVTIKVEKTPNQTLKWVSDFKDETSKDIWGEKTAGTTTVSGNWTDIAIKLTSVFSPLSNKKVSVRQTNQAFRYYSNDTLLSSKPTEAVFTAGQPNIWIPAADATDNLPVKWKGYSDASSLVKSGQPVNGTTWGILLWNAATTQPPQIALEIYDESDTTRKLVTKIEIDYSDLLP